MTMPIDKLNACMDCLRDALEGHDESVVLTALAAVLGEAAINATQGDADVALELVVTSLEEVYRTIDRGADAFAVIKAGGLN